MQRVHSIMQMRGAILPGREEYAGMSPTVGGGTRFEAVLFIVGKGP